MPYIRQSERFYYTPNFVDNTRFTVPGELNFAFTEIIKKYLEDRGLCYTTINDVAGALECCKAEFYRRVVMPYEDEKIKQNGDVYGRRNDD